MPPATVVFTDPLVPPKQLTDVVTPDKFKAVGCVIVYAFDTVQLFASVTVTVYVPAETFVKSCVTALLLH